MLRSGDWVRLLTPGRVSHVGHNIWGISIRNKTWVQLWKRDEDHRQGSEARRPKHKWEIEY
jgi:hypothetical protein